MAKKKPRSVPDWDSYFMMLALVASMRSKDPSTQIGSVIVDRDHSLLASGYNGTVLANDGDIDWSRPQKYPYLQHAEQNAISNYLSNCGRVDQGIVMYVTGQPCHVCVNMAAANKISKIIYGPQKINMIDQKEWETSKNIAAKSKNKIELVRFVGNLGAFLDQIDLIKRNCPEFFCPLVQIPA